MRAYTLPALAALLLAMALVLPACAPGARARTTSVIAPCVRPRVDLRGLAGVYVPAASNDCQVAVLPTGLSSWLEAPLNSHRVRGLDRVVLGCANLTPDAASCDYGGPLAHSVSAMLDFDASRYPEAAVVQKAVLAIRIENNVANFVRNVQLRGRLMTGDTLQSLGADGVTPAAEPGWVQFEVTSFVARAINERRPNIHFEVSLPCGRDESELTTMSMIAAEPRLIVEFR